MPLKRQKITRYRTYRRRRTPHLKEGLEWFKERLLGIAPAVVGLALVVIGIRVSFGSLLLSDSFHVDKVEAYRDGVPSILENFDGYQINSKTLIHQANLVGLKHEILNRHPEFKSVIVKRILPNTLRIELESRRPIAQIFLGKYYPVDSQGRALPAPKSLADPGLPIIKGMNLELNEIKVGREYHSDRLTKALVLLDAIRSSQAIETFEVAAIDVMDNNSIDFYLKSGIQVKIGREFFPERLKMLARVLSQLAVPQDQIRYIDLRFDDPVIGPKNTQMSTDKNITDWHR